jgi:membrane protease YdiL (CAAX protease family)
MRTILGPAYYEPRTAWGPIQALLIAVAGYVVVEVGARYAVSQVLNTMGRVWWPGRGGFWILATFLVWARLLFGAVLLGTAWLLARRGGMRASEVLALRMPLCGARVLALVGVVVAIGLAADLVVQLVRHTGLQRDLFPANLRASMVRYAGWPLAILSIAIVVPIAQEIWFRGLLLPALAQTRLGFWGAALLTSALFAAAHLWHAGLTALVPVFLGGLFLAWTLGLTGSLWVPIAIHVSYNLLTLLWMRLWLWDNR